MKTYVEFLEEKLRGKERLYKDKRHLLKTDTDEKKTDEIIKEFKKLTPEEKSEVLKELRKMIEKE